MMRAAVISLCFLFSACPKNYSREIPPEKTPVRVLQTLPQGVYCQNLETLSLRDGVGCANIGRYRQGQLDSLYYNLEQQARKRGANVAIISQEIQEESYEGCPQSGLIAEFKLYHCNYHF